MPNNEKFKIILHDAKLICRQKFETVKSKFGKNNTDVKKMQEELKSVFRQFDNPAVWSETIEFDHVSIMTRILKVGVADPSDLPNYVKVTADLLNTLKEDVLKIPMAKVKAMLPSDWNLKTLDALRLAHQRVAGRERYFKNRGQDLSQNDAFKKIDEKHNLVAAEYRLLLNTNVVQSNQANVILIKQFGEMIKQCTTVPFFLEMYIEFSDYVAGEIPSVV